MIHLMVMNKESPVVDDAMLDSGTDKEFGKSPFSITVVRTDLGKYCWVSNWMLEMFDEQHNICMISYNLSLQ